MIAEELIKKLQELNVGCFSNLDKIYFYGETNKLKGILNNIDLDKVKNNLLEKQGNNKLFPMNSYQKSMVYQELFSKDLSANVLVHLFNYEKVISEKFLKRLLRHLYERWPIMFMKIKEDKLNFFFSREKNDNLNKFFITDNYSYADIDEFEKKYARYTLSLFNDPLFALLKVKISDNDRLVLVIHHIVYDSDFIIQFIKYVQGILNSGEIKDGDNTPDFQFVQNNWNINNGLEKNIEQYEHFWLQKKFKEFDSSNLVLSEIKNHEVVISEKYIGKIQGYYNASSLSFIISGLLSVLPNYLKRNKVNFVLTLKQEKIISNEVISGFSTNLVPMQLEKIDSSNDDLISYVSDSLSKVILNGLLPKEKIFDLLALRDENIDCLFNFIKIQSISELDFFSNFYNYKARYPLTITAFMTLDQQLIVKIKSKVKIDLEKFGEDFRSWIIKALENE